MSEFCEGFCTLCGTGCAEYCRDYRELRAELADTEQRRLSALGMIDEMSKENWELLEKGFPVPPEEVKALRAACEVYEEALASISLPLRGSTEVDKLLETMNNDMDVASEALARGRALKEGKGE